MRVPSWEKRQSHIVNRPGSIWIPSFIALTTVFALLLIPGPSFQTYLGQLLLSDASTIYSAAYAEDWPSLPSVSEWLSTAIEFPIALLAPVLALVALRGRTARALFRDISLIACVLLIVCDSATAIAQGTYSAGSLFEDVVGDATGGVLLSTVFISIVRATDLLFDHLDGTLLFRRMFIYALWLLLSVSISLLIYLLVVAFYKLTPEQTAVYMDPPFSATISPAATTINAEAKPNARPFSFFPIESLGHSVTFMGAGSKADSSLAWQRERNDEPYTLEVSFFEGCQTDAEARALNINDIQLALSDVSLLRWPLASNGMVQVTSSDPAEGGKSVKVEAQDPYFFWLERDEAAKTYGVQAFIGERDTETFENTGSASSVFVSSILSADAQTHYVKGRSYTFLIGDVSYSVDVRDPRIVDMSAAVSCSVLPAQWDFQRKVFTAEPSAPVIGIRFRVAAIRAKDQVASGRGGAWTITKGSGWFRESDIAEDAFRKTHFEGAANALFVENVKSLVVGDAQIEPHPSERFQVLGESFTAGVEPNGRLRFLGKANIVWRDNRRLNKTRWEKTETSERLVLVGGVGTVLAIWLRWFIGILSGNAQLFRPTLDTIGARRS